MVYLLPFLSYLANSKSVSVRPPTCPPIRPGYDDKYRSRSYRFVERQKRPVLICQKLGWCRMLWKRLHFRLNVSMICNVVSLTHTHTHRDIPFLANYTHRRVVLHVELHNNKMAMIDSVILLHHHPCTRRWRTRPTSQQPFSLHGVVIYRSSDDSIFNPQRHEEFHCVRRQCCV